MDENEYKVAQTAAGDFVDDVECVTGQGLQLKHSIDELSRHAVLIGTIAQSTIIDKLVKAVAGKKNRRKFSSFLGD